MLSLRTTFHKRGRLILAAAMLGAGGAAFIAALNVAASWDRVLEADSQARRYDIDVRFAADEPIDRIQGIVRTVPGIVRAEFWPDTGAALIEPDGGSDARVSIFAPPPETPLLRLPLLEGRWLRPDDRSAVVVNQTLLARYRFLEVGKPIRLKIGKNVASWQIVGVVEEMGPHLALYAPEEQVRKSSGARIDLTRGARIVTREHDARSQLAVSREFERALREAGIGVAVMQSLQDRRQAVADHLVIIQNALAAASTLVVLVAGLALSSTLSLSVIERRREFGVLSAIGASPATISRAVVTEALLIGFLGWLAAIALAIPATAILNRIAGQMFRRSGLPFYMSPDAVAACLLFILVISAICSFYPAWRSARMPVREALAYE